MADMIEEKWPKTLVGCIIFLFVLILLLATLVPNAMIDKAMETERNMAARLLPEKDLTVVINHTDAVYTSWMIHSGLKEAVANVFMPQAPTTVEAFEEKAGWWFEYLAKRGEALMKIGYQLTYRVLLALYWMPYFLVVLVPSVFGGLLRWRAKRLGFEYSSPFINNNAINLLKWGAILMVVSIILPAPLPPLLICTVLLAGLPVVFSLLISNLPKRI